MLAAACAILTVAVAAGPTTHAGRAVRTVTARSVHARHAAAPRLRTPTPLEKARALLAEVRHDPAKRRYRDRWERAINALEKAARGRDKAPALLEAARARYALYRFSQVESDRDAALTLAGRASRAGSRDADAFARAIRKEMGEEETVATRSRPPKRPSAPVVSASTGRPVVPSRHAAPARAAQEPSPKAPAQPAIPSPPATSSQPSQPVMSSAQPPAPPPPPSADVRGEAAPSLADPAARAGGATETAPSMAEAGDGDDEPPTDPVLQQALEHAEAALREEKTKAPARVSDVKTWSNGDYTRVAIYLTRSIGFTREEVPSEDGHPRRLALDLKPALLGRGLAHDVGDALVKRVRAAQRDADTVRVVLDLAGRDDLSIFALSDPPRLIVDVGTREPRREVAAPARPRVERDDDGELAARRPIHRIIVDAGHGGHDTGAIGPTKVREKDVTLAMARRLARHLRDRGFEVVLTRRDDRFVALEERTAIANARHGDLFVSLHANANPRRDRRGVETYVLNVADDRYAARLAARENGALDETGGDGTEVRRILSDLDAKSSVDASRRLAQSVQQELCSGIRSRIGDVRDLGVKSALFYVLLGARMPAVLVETSFISNRVEEKRLASTRFQDEVASAVTRAVERFASREARVASAR